MAEEFKKDGFRPADVAKELASTVPPCLTL